MKYRSDFVSNSSSTSFMCYVKNPNEVNKYVALFKELVNELNEPYKGILFETAIFNKTYLTENDVKVLEKYDTQTSWAPFQSDNLTQLNRYHYIFPELDNDEAIKQSYIAVNVVPLLQGYLTDKELEPIINKALVMLFSEECWENESDYDSDRFFNLRTYLDKHSINYDVSEASV